MAEFKLKYSEDQVGSREELFRNLIESSSDIITLLNGDLYVSYSSPSVERILGYEPEELNNRPIYEIIHPDDLPAVVLTLSNAASTLGEVYSEKYRSRHKDGTWRYMEATGKALLSKETKGLVYIINSRDISEAVQTERLLQYKVNELNTFMYKATHDLRAPLSSLLGLIALAKQETNPESLQHYFGMIDESTRKMDKILVDLVDITKIAQGIPEISEVDLPTLVKDIVSSLENTPGYREIVFSARLQLTRPFYSDPKLLHSILQNLLDNSAKYRSGGHQNYVDVEAEETANAIKLYITDNGLGIAERYQQKVFNMFYRATLQSNGTGLGLYIVKNAIEKLGGTVELESREGVGTRVTLTLPYTCALN
ncbi:MAG TPA: PAS domain-containing sensor histidine kinase [Bacteroidia bacterium]|jgi:PAS domain S-box-containing protein|nr:PAS domain-containing sensor histidine kinase [Bacteroidia bacterium]